MSNWSNREEAMMKAAIWAAHQSIEPNRHGAILAKRGHLCTYGWNKNKTHPAAVVYYSKCIHAELAAIIQLDNKDLSGLDIYVARIMRSKGEPLGMSRPCRVCMRMLTMAGIRRIYFTNKQGEWAMEKA